jgi:hypothetical protein
MRIGKFLPTPSSFSILNKKLLVTHMKYQEELMILANIFARSGLSISFKSLVTWPNCL